MTTHNGLNFSKRTKHLVVITPGGIFWLLWCLDYINHLVKSGETVVVVDLNQLTSKKKRRIKFQRLKNIYRINDEKVLISNLKDKEGVKFLRPRLFFSLKIWGTKFHKIHSIEFKNGLDAEFFEETGQRILEEDILNRRALIRSKIMFDFTFSRVLEIIKREQITHMAVPGGRTLIPAACLSSGLSIGINCEILEFNDRGSLGYCCYSADFRKSCRVIQEEIMKNWDAAGFSKYEVAKEFLENKLFRQNSKGIDFAGKFLSGQVIEEFREVSYVAFFLTSGFEFNSFPGELQIGEFSKIDQMEKVQQFCSIAKEFGYLPVVRAHPPRLGHEKISAIDDLEWSKFCVEIGAMYISTEDRLSSYELMKNSQLNAVYLSTAGIDSLILGAQTIILGNAEYAQLVPELCAFNETSIRARFDKRVVDIDLNKILPYAYYMATLGTELENSWVTPEGRVYYNGRELNRVRFSLVRYLVDKFKNL